MLVVKLDTGFNIEVEFPIAPFHRRFFAWIIDFLILVSYMVFAYYLMQAILGDYWIISYSWLWLCFWIPYFLYHLVMESLANGQSIGKKLMGIKVITME